MAQLVTPLSWANHTGGQTKFEVDDGTISELLVGFAERFPGVRPRLIDARGDLHRYFKVFVGDAMVRYDEFPLTRTERDTVVQIIPPMAGG